MRRQHSRWNGGFPIHPDLFAQPIFVCFVSITTCSAAPEVPICSLLFRDCSARKSLALPHSDRAVRAIISGLPSIRQIHTKINTSAFVGTNSTDEAKHARLLAKALRRRCAFWRKLTVVGWGKS